MPKSILEIEVNDEQFRAYLETFNRYQEQIKKMPDPWKETGQEAASVAATIAGMTIALDLHYDKVRKLAELEKEEAEARKKADEEHRRRLEEESDIEKDNEARRRKAITQTKEIAKNVADTALSLGKWALMGEGAALVGGALGLWGLDKFVEDIGRERRLAQGFGVTTGERQALSLQMQRYFDVNSNLENIAEAQADPSKRWAFSAMGVNYAGKDPAQLALEMATRAREIFIQGRGNEQYAQAHGLLQFYTMDELRRLQATRPQDLAASVAATRRDIGLGISDRDSKIWQDFVIKVQEAGRTVENAFIKKLSELERNHVLDRLTAAFTKLATDVIEKIDFDKLEKALETFATYLGSPKFQQDFQTVITDMGFLADKLAILLRVLGLLPQGPPAGDTHAAPISKSAPGATDRTDQGGYYTHDIWGNPVWHAPENPFFDEVQAKISRMTGGDIKKGAGVAARLQRDLGIGAGGASGLVGNLLAEDPGLVPMNERNVKKGRGGYGWAMWTGQRRIDFENWAAAHHRDVRDDQTNYDYLIYELRTKYPALLKKIQGESAQQATIDIYKTFEAPAAGDKTLAQRIHNAMQVNVSVQNQTGHSVAATANAASR